MGNRELTGLEILDELQARIKPSLGFGVLYPALNRLEKYGKISRHHGCDGRVRYFRSYTMPTTLFDSQFDSHLARDFCLNLLIRITRLIDN